MKKDDVAIPCVFLALIALFIFIGYSVGYSRAERRVQQEAVDNHAASWECDQKDGSPHLKWHGHKRGDSK